MLLAHSLLDQLTYFGLRQLEHVLLPLEFIFLSLNFLAQLLNCSFVPFHRELIF